MIIISERKLSFDKNTFTTNCRLTVDIPIEFLVDSRVFQGEETLCATLGKELLEAVQGNNRLLIDCVKEACSNSLEENIL